MKISRDFQESLIAKIESQFHNATVSNDAVYAKSETKEIISQLRFNILNFYFEDDLLMAALYMLEEAIDYLEKLESRHPFYSNTSA
jgi:hypothetical protein